MNFRSRIRTPAAAVCVLIVGLIIGFAWKIPALQKWHLSRYKTIEDFSTGEKNHIGGERAAIAGHTSKLEQAIRPLGQPSSGDSLELRYAIPSHGQVKWVTGLNDMDVSQAKKLHFRLRLPRGPAPHLRLEIKDAFGSSAQYRLPRLQAKGRWQRVAIPMSEFEGINQNSLRELTLYMEAKDTAKEGVLQLDDIAFSGPPHMFFRSLADNLIAYPEKPLQSPRRLLALPEEAMLRQIAGDTWGYFRDLVNRRTHLPVNHIQTLPENSIGDYASTTDIAMYLLSVVSAYDFDLISQEDAIKRAQSTLKQLNRMARWEGLFYNYYNITNLQVTNHYISSVDNAWLVAGLVVVRQAFPDLEPLATALINDMHMGIFYDSENGQMLLGYDISSTGESAAAPYHYGLIVSEARIISMMAIGKGDVPEDHWFRVYRTLPKEWDWQKQSPRGDSVQYGELDVFQGHYVYERNGKSLAIVPSWGGSLFEFLMPSLIVDERSLAAKSLGINAQRAIEVHKDYGLKVKGYPVWGFSPSATPNDHGGYAEFGVPDIGAKGYPEEGVVTPHVSFLALMYDAPAAIENIRRLLRHYAIYGPYGFYDAVDAVSGAVAHRYLALDQGMILVSLNNYLNNGAIYRRVNKDRIMQRLRPLLASEEFFPFEGR